MAAQFPPLPKKFERLLTYITLRGKLLAANLADGPTIDDTVALAHLDRRIMKELYHLHAPDGILSDTLLADLLDAQYHLDFTPFASDNRLGHVYLGHVSNVRTVNVRKDEIHVFLACHSNYHGRLGASYPVHVQQGEIGIYTRGGVGGVTWLEGRRKAGEASQPIPFLQQVPLELLLRMRDDGIRNYEAIIPV